MNNEYEVLEIGNAQDVILGSKTELPPDADGQFVIGADSDFEEIGNAQDVILGSKFELPPDSDNYFIVGADSDLEE
jgi:hypothetical protein